MFFISDKNFEHFSDQNSKILQKETESGDDKQPQNKKLFWIYLIFMGQLLEMPWNLKILCKICSQLI